ncbi:uncharacterized protein METZ01_LOCUS406041, partial [marine metagenome]
VRVLFFWVAVGSLGLEYHCNPCSGLLDRALHVHDVHLDLGEYAFTKFWIEDPRLPTPQLVARILPADDLGATMQ